MHRNRRQRLHGVTRHLVLAGMLGLGVALSAPTPIAAVPAGTYTFNNPPVTIGTAAPAVSEAGYAGLPRQVLDLDVTLRSVDHPAPDDLDVMLAGPGGQTVVLMSDVGGEVVAATDLTLTFDDEAAGPAPDSGPLTGTSYQPTNVADGLDNYPNFPTAGTNVQNPLSVFDGTDPNGTWRLYVVNDTGAYAGDISGGWTLTFTTTDYPPPPEVMTPAAGTIDTDGLVTFAGTARPGDVVELRTDLTNVLGQTVASPGGGWALATGSLPDGSHQFFVNSRDEFGTTSAWIRTPLVTVDRVPPAGTISINAGAALTPTHAVTLSLAAADPAPGTGVTSVSLSHDGTSFSAFEPLSATRTWTLPPGADGLRTVWARFVDRAGHVSPVVSDSIVLDTLAPRVVGTRPAHRAEHVRIGVTVRATFSEAISPASITRGTVRLLRPDGRSVRARVSYDPDDRVVTVDPRRDLVHDTRYRLVIGGARDLAGNVLDQRAKPGRQAMTSRLTTR